jgi:hypothetical protein
LPGEGEVSVRVGSELLSASEINGHCAPLADFGQRHGDRALSSACHEVAAEASEGKAFISAPAAVGKRCRGRLRRDRQLRHRFEAPGEASR